MRHRCPPPSSDATASRIKRRLAITPDLFPLSRRSPSGRAGFPRLGDLPDREGLDSGFCEWRNKPASRRDRNDAQLANTIAASHADSRGAPCASTPPSARRHEHPQKSSRTAGTGQSRINRHRNVKHQPTLNRGTTGPHAPFGQLEHQPARTQYGRERRNSNTVASTSAGI